MDYGGSVDVGSLGVCRDVVLGPSPNSNCPEMCFFLTGELHSCHFL